MLTIQFFDVEIPRKLGHQSCVILTNFKTKDFHTFSHSLSLNIPSSGTLCCVQKYTRKKHQLILKSSCFFRNRLQGVFCFFSLSSSLSLFGTNWFRKKKCRFFCRMFLTTYYNLLTFLKRK